MSYASMHNKKPRNRSPVVIPDKDPEPQLSTISVCVRCRPLSKAERATNEHSIVHVVNDTTLYLLDSQPVSKKRRTRQKQFIFDHIFSEDSSQSSVFQATSKELIPGILAGFNATVFAYGATNAGKTYTMIGESTSFGFMYSTYMYLSSELEKSRTKEYTVKVSYLEIYNENVKDLLNPGPEFLELREDRAKGVVVSGLTEVAPQSVEQVLDLITMGNSLRTCEPTQANQTSSRSHAILQITVEHRKQLSELSTIGKLSLIDLAGSERASNTKNRGTRLIEGASINRSLLALGNCINALSDSNEKGLRTHIPYRDSKLTRLLKDSLGGNCNTMMIACISTHIDSYEDTNNTLQYASRARSIKVTATQNVINTTTQINCYTEIINKLRKEIYELKRERGHPASSTGFCIEKYLIQIKTHFQEEAKLRKAVCQHEKVVDSTALSLYSKSGENEGQMLLEAALNSSKKELEANEQKLRTLEKRRRYFEQSWRAENIPKPYHSELLLALKSNMLEMDKIDMERKKLHAETVVMQRDYLLGLIQERLPDNGDGHRAAADSPALPVETKTQLLFPSILTRIPKPRPRLKDVSEGHSPASTLTRNSSLGQGTMKYQLSVKRVVGSERTSSTITRSLGHPESKAVESVAEKFRNSPYVLGGRIPLNQLKYGNSIRRPRMVHRK